MPTVSMNAMRATRGSSTSVCTSADTRARMRSGFTPVSLWARTCLGRPMSVQATNAPAMICSPTATSRSSRFSNSS